jgi:RimJ/RimL family protein N-acetyltransferase
VEASRRWECFVDHKLFCVPPSLINSHTTILFYMVGLERINIRRGTEEDLEVLVPLSVQRDKEQRYGTDKEEIKTRMLEMMRSDYTTYLFEVRGIVIGYTLVSKNPDPLSIIEYFLLPEERGKGYGYDAVAKLMNATNSISLNVSPNAWRESAGAM